MSKMQNLKKPLLQILTAVLVLTGLVIGFSLPNPLQASSWTNPLLQLDTNLSAVKDKLENLFSEVNPAQLKNDLGLENESSPLPLDERVASYEEQITRVVEKSSPSVVSIIISKDLPVLEEYYLNPFQEFGIEVPEGFGIPQYRQKGTQNQEVGGGTGFILSSDGLIVTNKHVVSTQGADYTVLFNDGSRVSARVVAQDPVLDFAVLKVERTGLTPLPLGDSSSLKLGQTVIAIGNALGEFRNTVSVGVVSGLSRTVEVEGETLTELIQTDAAINRGNSGGPLLNLRGEVVGINVATALGAENISFSIPINQVKKSIQQVENTGSIKIAYLGVRYAVLNKSSQNRYGLSVDYGAWIQADSNGEAVISDSPAAKAGLRVGDIILEFDGTKITESNPLAVIIAKYSAGDKVALKVLRDNQEINLEATLGER